MRGLRLRTSDHQCLLNTLAARLALSVRRTWSTVGTTRRCGCRGDKLLLCTAPGRQRSRATCSRDRVGGLQMLAVGSIGTPGPGAQPVDMTNFASNQGDSLTSELNKSLIRHKPYILSHLLYQEITTTKVENPGFDRNPRRCERALYRFNPPSIQGNLSVILVGRAGD